GRKKYGAARFAAMGIAGRRRKGRNPEEHVASIQLGGAAAEIYRTPANTFEAVARFGKKTAEKVVKGVGSAMDWARDQVAALAAGAENPIDPLTAISLASTFGPQVDRLSRHVDAQLSGRKKKRTAHNPENPEIDSAKWWQHAGVV